MWRSAWACIVHQDLPAFLALEALREDASQLEQLEGGQAQVRFTETVLCAASLLAFSCGH